MNTEALFLFLILLLGLVLCSFLGGNCNREGLKNKNIVYKGPDGATATIIKNSDGTKSIQVNQTSGSGTAIFKQSSASSTVFTNPFGFTATFTNGNIVFTSPIGDTTTFTRSNDTSSTNTSSNSDSSINSNYDNYNHYSGTSSVLTDGQIFYGPNGGTVVVTPGGNGIQTLQIKLNADQTPMTFKQNLSSSKSEGYTNYTGPNVSVNTYYGEPGYTASVINTQDGKLAVQVQTPYGNYVYTQSGTYYNPDNTTSTQYYGSTGYAIQPSSYSLSYQGPYGGSAGSVTGPQGNTAYYAQGPYGNTMVATPSSNGYDDTYYSTLPPGVSKSQIPPGQEDLYILKSEIVPPVCPACPTSAACPRQEPCPPCPACARCPEPSFECKKVPNYNAISDQYLPQPVLSDFSQFGM